MTKQKSKQKHRWLWALLLAGIILLGDVAFPFAGAQAAAQTPALKSEEPIYKSGRLKGYVTNILFVLEDEKKPAACILFSHNAAEQRITALTFLTDTVVNDGGSSAGMADVYAGGGIKGLMKAINSTFGTDVSEYALLTTASLSSLVDHMGGISAKISASEADYLRGLYGGAYAAEGNALLDGRSVAALVTKKHSRRRRGIRSFPAPKPPDPRLFQADPVPCFG